MPPLWQKCLQGKQQKLTKKMPLLCQKCLQEKQQKYWPKKMPPTGATTLALPPSPLHSLHPTPTPTFPPSKNRPWPWTPVATNYSSIPPPPLLLLLQLFFLSSSSFPAHLLSFLPTNAQRARNRTRHDDLLGRVLCGAGMVLENVWWRTVHLSPCWLLAGPPGAHITCHLPCRDMSH